MANVIDSLFVELGMDTSKFTKSQQDALGQWKKTQEEMERGAKDIEGQGQRMTNAISGLKREALGFLAVFMGGKALKDFATHVVEMDATTGRFARTVNVSTHDLSVWQNMVHQSGGSVEDARASVKGLSDTIQTSILTQNWDSGLLSVLRRANVSPEDYTKPLVILEAFSRLADQMRGTPEGAAQFANWMKLAGMNDGTINTLLQGHDAFVKLREEQEKLGPITEANAKAAIELDTAWRKAEDAGVGLGNRIINFLAPALVKLLNFVTNTLNMPTAEQAKQDLVAALPEAGLPGGPDWLGGGGAASGGATGGGLSIKPGAGSASQAMKAVLSALAGTDGLKQVTALNDSYHQQFGGAHTDGRAVDITINDASQSGAAAAAIRARLKAQGIDATVIDEYKNPSKHATGGHIHVGLSEAQAQKLEAGNQLWNGWFGTGQAFAGVAAGAQASANINNSRSNSSRTSTTDVKVNTISVQADNADVHKATASGFYEALGNIMNGANFDGGPH